MSRKKSQGRPMCMYYNTDECTYKETNIMKRCKGTGIMKDISGKRQNLSCYTIENNNKYSVKNPGELNKLEARV